MLLLVLYFPLLPDPSIARATTDHPVPHPTALTQGRSGAAQIQAPCGGLCASPSACRAD